ncbi:MAG: HGGxSTG domain-containing protein [Gammaproteobacteria bacterium]
MAKNPDEPHEPRVLRNGTRAADFASLSHCGAKTRAGTPCRRIGRKSSGRCRLHGGRSTGPKTAEGLARSRRANWRHGGYSAEAEIERRRFRVVLQEALELLADLDDHR